MKKVLKFALLAIAILVLAGCTRAQLAGQAAERVCTMDEEDAVALRYAVDRAADPHKVRIECADELEAAEED